MPDSTFTRIQHRSGLLALVLFPFITHSSGAGGAIGWLIGIAVVLARWTGTPTRATWILASIAALVASAIGPFWFRGTSYHFGMIALSAIGLGVILADQRITPRSALAVSGGASLTALVWSVTHDPGGFLDVALMHRAGAVALRTGVSPWSALAVPSGAPGALGTVITGDPYPPVALVWYSVGDWLTNDPRAGGAVAWVALIAAVMNIRTSNHRPLVALLTSGALPVLLWTGWTEFVTIALIATAVACWRRPVFASVALGMALASKQYMVVAAPLVFTLRSPPVGLRRSVTLSTAAILALSGFAFGSGYLDATIGAYVEFDTRTDSSSLFGLLALFMPGISAPVWLGPGLAIGVAAGLAIAQKTADVSSFLTKLGTALAVLFLLGTQAFANYWFLVWAMIMVAVSATPATGLPANEAIPRE